MKSKLLGGILLTVGTAVGGSMLALPAITASEGFLASSLLLVGCWALMTLGAYYLIEVNLWLDEGSNLISMAKVTLGLPGQIVAYIAYLLLLYFLIAAYISGGADLLRHLLGMIHIQTPAWLDTVIFVLIFGGVVYRGIALVDAVNRGLMSLKGLFYFLFIAVTISFVNPKHWVVAHPVFYISTVMVMINSFGFATLIPSLRSYFNSDAKMLKKSFFYGSVIPLFVYIVWDGVVHGVVPREGKDGLLHVATSGHVTSQLARSLGEQVHVGWVAALPNMFISVCVLTSFLGVALCLFDFLSDGLRLPKTTKNKPILFMITFLPPALLSVFDPGAFIVGLSYAGVFCVILLMLMPALMTWVGRYRKGYVSDQFQVPGGKPLLAVTILAGISMLVVGLLTGFHVIG